ncbi:MAG: galactitol-1-phosphate 5-dehydrogenase [Spirochaetes bacterium]|nr:galactitol-1-phosphate 5-dehydrogenase [Spirochaetota bacterium]
MKAAVLHNSRDIRCDVVENPVINEDEILVKVKAAGICGSDIPRVLGNAAHSYPVILGHEFSGEVTSVGSKVNNFSIGDRIAGVPLVPCMKCDDCQNGNYSQCGYYSFIGSRQQGAFAEYIKLNSRQAVKFDKSVSFEVGAFFEPATVALHGLMRVDYKGGGNVAILGGGTIGLFCAQWARIFGAATVTVFDVDNDRLELVKETGADFTVNTGSPDFREKAFSQINAAGFDYVYETAGVDATMKIAFEIAGKKSNVCFIGTSPRDLTFPHQLFELMNRKEFILTGSWMSYSAPFPGREWTLTGQYFADGRLKFNEKLIYKKYSIDDVRDAFAEFETPGKVKGKILLVF